MNYTPEEIINRNYDEDIVEWFYLGSPVIRKENNDD